MSDSDKKGGLSDEYMKNYHETCAAMEDYKKEVKKAFKKAKTADKLKRTLEYISNFDRKKGYPTGTEWIKLVDEVKGALKVYEDE